MSWSTITPAGAPQTPPVDGNASPALHMGILPSNRLMATHVDGPDDWLAAWPVRRPLTLTPRSSCWVSI